MLIYRVRSDRFLHMMVRLLVGTMVDIGRGRWSPGRMQEILMAQDVRLCGVAAPAHGLTLVAVDYPEALDRAGDFS
jgi:tRNA pseudouridine38-40 synthase